MSDEGGYSYDPESGGMSDPGYSYDPTAGGSSDQGPMSIDPNGPAPTPAEPLEGWEVPSLPLSDGEKEGILHVAGHVIGEFFESSPLGVAIGVAGMESDESPGQREYREDAQQQGELQDDIDQRRNDQMSESLPGHVVEMNASAEPEPEAFGPPSPGEQ